jgi:hypothetical protein
MTLTARAFGTVASVITNAALQRRTRSRSPVTGSRARSLSRAAISCITETDSRRHVNSHFAKPTVGLSQGAAKASEVQHHAP